MILPPDHSRLTTLYHAPETVLPEEVTLLAEEVLNTRRILAKKNLRDEFAMAALTGLMDYAAIGVDMNEQVLAGLAYDYADAMILRRQTHPKVPE